MIWHFLVFGVVITVHILIIYISLNWHLIKKFLGDVFGCVLEQEIGNLSFDKDDQLAVEFVTAAANTRAASFGIPLHSLFEAKGIAGNIVHAVATTNAIIAGLIVIEAIKVLKNDIKSYRYDDNPLPICSTHC